MVSFSQRLAFSRKPRDSLPEIRGSSKWIIAQRNLLSCSQYIVSENFAGTGNSGTISIYTMVHERGHGDRESEKKKKNEENCTRGHEYSHILPLLARKLNWNINVKWFIKIKLERNIKLLTQNIFIYIIFSASDGTDKRWRIDETIDAGGWIEHNKIPGATNHRSADYSH